MTVGNLFVFKRISIVHDKKDTKPNVLFKPPWHWNQLPANKKRENIQLEQNNNDLQLDDGDIPYKNLMKSLASIIHLDDIVYIKGFKKSKRL